MKSFKTTLIYLGIVLLLGGYIYFFERGPAKDKDQDQPKPKLFTGFVADDITDIVIDHYGTTVTALKEPIEIKQDAKSVWQILSPKPFTADESTVRSLLTAVGQADPDDTVANPANLDDFGLKSPRADCIFTSKTGKKLTLSVGDKNPTGDSVYTKTSEGTTVYLLNSYIVDGLFKDENNFRDKTFFKTDEVLAKKIEVDYNGQKTAFEKQKDGVWYLTAPVSTKADQDKVRSLLNTVNELRVNDFVEDHPANLSVYGLSHPKASIKIWPADGSAPQGILVGRAKPKAGGVFARNQGLPYVYLIGQYFADGLNLKLNDYRDKNFLQFDADKVKALTVHHAQKDYVYQKQTGGTWTCVGRPQASGEASSLVTQLSGLSVTDFPVKPKSTGLSDPAFTVQVDFTDTTPSRIYCFGRREKDDVYVSQGKGQEPYLVPSGVLSQMEGYFNNVLTPMAVASPTTSH